MNKVFDLFKTWVRNSDLTLKVLINFQVGSSITGGDLTEGSNDTHITVVMLSMLNTWVQSHEMDSLGALSALSTVLIFLVN